MPLLLFWFDENKEFTRDVIEDYDDDVAGDFDWNVWPVKLIYEDEHNEHVEEERGGSGANKAQDFANNGFGRVRFAMKNPLTIS